MLNDWRLTYDGVDFSFGTIASKFVFPQDGPPSVSNIDIDDEDTRRPQADGLMFGMDTRNGTTITFDVTVNGDTETEANTLLAAISKAWRGDSIRATPGAMAVLTSHTGRSVFGRPRRFKPDYELTPFGITAVTCDFQTADDLWYGPEDSAIVRLIPDVGGGLIAPLAAPLSTTASSDRSQPFTIGGTIPAWPVFTISGPIANPEIEVVNQFRLAFNRTLAYDETLVIDTRPWARSITVNGKPAAGSLLASADRLSDAALPPGTYDLALRGQSATGTPQVRVTWRAAYPTM